MSESSSKDFDFYVVDLNGNLRGKRMPVESITKVLSDGIKLPRSVLAIDFWGEDVADNGLVFETGDNDGLCLPIMKSPKHCTWNNMQQIQGMMFEPDGQAFMCDPRQILSHVFDQYKALGLTPVVATELEFYLLDAKKYQQGIAAPALSPISHRAMNETDGYSIDMLDELQIFLTDVRVACNELAVPADAVISEIGPGQFEINLNHQPNPVTAADDAICFKRIVKGVARQHGFEACFMAKPFVDHSGNGFHVHFSVLDNSGNNIFNDGSDIGSDHLRYAVCGLLETMAESMLLFAPNQNSYRRFLPGTHAPTMACWGYDNRTSSLRIPDSPAQARRIEHRVSGADANPYLVIAAVLAGALHGVNNKQNPPQPITGNAYELSEHLTGLPNVWPSAIEAFGQGNILPKYLGDMLHPVYTAIKRQEHTKLAKKMTDVELDAYLGRI